MAWQMACQSVLIHKRWLPSFVSHVRSAPSSSARNVSSSAPNHGFREICRELRLHHFLRLHVLFYVTNFHCFMVVDRDALSEPVHFSDPNFTCKPCTTVLTGQSPSFCCFAKIFSALIKVSQTPCGAACAQKTFSSRRFSTSSPVVRLVVDQQERRCNEEYRCRLKC